VFGLAGQRQRVNNMIEKELDVLIFVVANTGRATLQQAKAEEPLQLASKYRRSLVLRNGPSVRCCCCGKKAIEQIVDTWRRTHVL